MAAGKTGRPSARPVPLPADLIRNQSGTFCRPEAYHVTFGNAVDRQDPLPEPGANSAGAKPDAVLYRPRPSSPSGAGWMSCSPPPARPGASLRQSHRKLPRRTGRPFLLLDGRCRPKGPKSPRCSSHSSPNADERRVRCGIIVRRVKSSGGNCPLRHPHAITAAATDRDGPTLVIWNSTSPLRRRSRTPYATSASLNHMGEPARIIDANRQKPS